ncbi:putative HET-domain-containing protein [Seiridium cardinale]|uniref:HET-domain-containing protein n=1 Tax=Seiridium cardinale TaxID=138064 RepID=A0ABR2XRK4_9PEZI
MSRSQRRNVHYFLAAAAGGNIISAKLCAIGILVLREAFETAQEMGDDKSEDSEDKNRTIQDLTIVDLLGCAELWMLKAWDPIRKLSSTNFCDYPQEIGRHGPLAQEAGVPDNGGFSQERLGAFSFMETRGYYDEFLGTADSISLALKALLRAWCESSEGRTVLRVSAEVPTFPHEQYHRFQWGDYAALSYAWGDLKDTSDIIVNGMEVQVTTNLANALQELYQGGNFSGRLRLWIDALCINQKDLEERNQQVAAMRSFYSNAWSVVSFVGPETENSAKALNLVAELSKHYGNAAECQALQHALMHDQDPYEPGSWLALNLLTLRPYWERLWVIQEITLGGTRVVLRCGLAQLSWQTFCHGLELIHKYLWLAKNKCVMRDRMEIDPTDTRGWDTSGPMHHISKDLWAFTEAQESRSANARLDRLLEVANFSKCSDSRDKVYGLLGIMEPHFSKSINPDYSLSAASVFMSTAKAYIKAYGTLELLRDANIWGSAVTATWVPDWTWRGRLRDSRPEFGSDASADGANDVPFKGTYCADRGLLLVMPEYRGDLLGCQVIIFDEVDGLGAHPLAEGAIIVQSQQTAATTGHVDETALRISRTLCAERDPTTSLACSLLHLPQTNEAAVKEFSRLSWDYFLHDMFYYERWTSWFPMNADLAVEGRDLKSYFSGMIQDGAAFEHYWTAYQVWQRAAHGRRFMTTAAGRFGWAPFARATILEDVSEVRRGDVLAIFPGCSSTPIILRSKSFGDVFQVVGEALPDLTL